MRFRILYKSKIYDNLKISFFNETWRTEGEINIGECDGKLLHGLPIEDKHGTAIYEGDVIQFNDGKVGHIVWDGYSFNMSDEIIIDEDWELEKAVVIGNIYVRR